MRGHLPALLAAVLILEHLVPMNIYFKFKPTISISFNSDIHVKSDYYSNK